MAIYPNPATVRVVMDKTTLCTAIKLINNLFDDPEINDISKRTGTKNLDTVGVLLMIGMVGYAELCVVRNNESADEVIEQIKNGIGLINESLRSEK